jgi:hypothetical protein
MAVFHDKGSLDTFSNISKIVMSVHGIKVKFIKSIVDPEAAEILQTSWGEDLQPAFYGLQGNNC